MPLIFSAIRSDSAFEFRSSHYIPVLCVTSHCRFIWGTIDCGPPLSISRHLSPALVFLLAVFCRPRCPPLCLSLSHQPFPFSILHLRPHASWASYNLGRTLPCHLNLLLSQSPPLHLSSSQPPQRVRASSIQPPDDCGGLVWLFAPASPILAVYHNLPFITLVSILRPPSSSLPGTIRF